MSDRFMLNLGDLLDEQVEEVARRAGITKGEVVRHALRLFLPLQQAAASGATLQIVMPDGTIRDIVPLTLGGTVTDD